MALLAPSSAAAGNDEPPAGAHGPGGPGDWASPDRVDHHHRPPQYDDPDLVVPPSSGADPDYPLAVGFTPADSSNYTAGGIVSFDYVVVHTMQGYYAGSISWFQNPAANVSAHYVMRSDDGEVTQMVRDTDRAWHVGSSNSYALGIEHEGFIDDGSWYTWQTYLSSARLTRWLCEEHDIPVDRDHIVGHVELPNQTHTDPGPLWNWDLYMALIRDVVPQGEVHGVVVDRSQACELTTVADTWIKATLQSSADLADDQRCQVPAGTTLTVLHHSEEMVGHARLHFDDGGSPCAGALGQGGFAWLDDLDGPCEPDVVAAAGALVTLDGGEAVEVDADGRFVMFGVAPGAHTIEVSGDGFVDEGTVVDVQVYPGARVVMGVDPVPSGEDTTGGAGEGGTEGDSGDLPGGTGGGDDLPDDGEATTGTGGDDQGRALPPGFGEDDGQGCGCSHGGRPGSIAWILPLLVLGLRRRAT
ncbi:MAG: N-acetylmuramoyl-L-alanine amidase [Nannocystaceae bacterium]